MSDMLGAAGIDNVNSDSPPSLSEDLHIEESGTTAVVFTFAALSQVSIGASVAFLPVLLLQLTRSTTTFLNTELHLIHSQIVLADCLLLAGLVIALVASGWLVSTIGRRCSMIAATLVSIASWLVHALATDVTILFLGRRIINVTLFCASRFLAGVSAGFLKLSVTTYIMEVMVVSNRGRVLVCLEMMKIFGSIISYGLNLLLPWYHIAFLNGTWMVVCMIAFIFLPESPAFLLIKQKEEKALKELQRIRSSDSKVDAELQIIKSLNPEERAKCTSLFGKPVISNTITILGLLLLSVFCGSPIIMIRGADMLLYTGFGWRMEAAVVLVLICLFLGCLLLFCLVDEISRRLCLMMSLAILVVVNIALGVISYITSHSITDATHDTPMVLARVCLILVAAFTVTLGSHTVPTILAAEYFHAYCRPQVSSRLPREQLLVTQQQQQQQQHGQEEKDEHQEPEIEEENCKLEKTLTTTTTTTTTTARTISNVRSRDDNKQGTRSNRIRSMIPTNSPLTLRDTHLSHSPSNAQH
ncbi:Facilitated trehalose transporter Tret1 [Portunus trituberculatus]|uniref:Facilitated trehalose transporter Tret1 n=1 Tax=Portunus trituberculatus TaxID=210409 RepID=A0A5B7EE38_PORTR|nr:Facilitated trehalose transporter Tret1 [Portunus trituberculatus]